jgi:hypothetical protein
VQNSTRFQAISDRITYNVATINANETFSIYMRGSGALHIQLGNNHNFYPSLTNEWVRYEFKTTQAGLNGSVQIRGAGSAVDVQLYGAQYERNGYLSSYIPTYGSAVTRVVDWCRNNSATSLIGQTEGTLFLDLNVTTIDENSFLFGIYGGGNEIYFRGSTLNKIGFVHYFGGAVANIPTTTLSEGRYKLAACYKNNDWVLYLNGSLVGTDPSGTFSGGSINNVTLGYISIGAYPPFESVNQVILFPTRLTDEELADLTTL